MANDYPPNWPEIAGRVKVAAGNACEHCGHPHDTEAGYMLTVHHLDLNKANCDWTNTVAMCQRCHLRWQATWRPGQQMLPGFEAPGWMTRRGLA